MSSEKKGEPTPKAPQNQKKANMLFPSRVQACMMGGSGGVKEIAGQDYFSFVVEVPGGTVELLWPFKSTPDVIDSLQGTYDDAVRGGVEGKSKVVTPAQARGGVVDLGSKRRG